MKTPCDDDLYALTGDLLRVHDAIVARVAEADRHRQELGTINAVIDALDTRRDGILERLQPLVEVLEDDEFVLVHGCALARQGGLLEVLRPVRVLDLADRIARANPDPDASTTAVGVTNAAVPSFAAHTAAFATSHGRDRS